VASASNLIVVGRLTSVYGVKGWLKVRSHTEPPENLFTYQPWLLNTLNGFQSVLVEQWHFHSKGFVVKIADTNDCQQAKSLCALDVSIEKTHLSPLGESQYYWHQLQGLRVISRFNNDETYLGTVKELIPTGANDVLVVRGDNDSVDRRERLIPYVLNRYVRTVDIENGTIHVDWDPEF
jgi:16S rRNA processing protein RimM